MHRLLATLTLLAGLVFTAAAHADTFDFTISAAADGLSGTTSGTLSATNLGLGVFSINGITGHDVTGLLAPGDFHFNDNLLYAPGFLDPLGFAFMDVNSQGTFDVDIFEAFGAAFAAIHGSDGINTVIPISLSLTAVTPEPSSVLLLATGLFGVLILARKRFLHT